MIADRNDAMGFELSAEDLGDGLVAVVEGQPVLFRDAGIDCLENPFIISWLSGNTAGVTVPKWILLLSHLGVLGV
jgi:hypothetical protein